MKKLRQLLRRSGWLSSNQRRSRPTGSSSESRGGKRRLHSETLEKRQLLAGDIALAHNYNHALDVDDNYEITARDALIVVNHLARHGGGQEITEFDDSMHYVDVNGDGMVTSNDALQVINGLAVGEGVGETVELILGARTVDDVEIAADGEGDINVQVGETFHLELGYQDLRTGLNRLGVAKYIADIGISADGVLIPALTETQRIGFTQEILDETQGTITLSLAGSTQTVDIPVTDFFASNTAPATQTEAALVTLGGYSEDEVSAEFLNLSSDDSAGDNLTDLFVLVRYLGDSNVDRDFPALEVSVSGTAQSISTSAEEFNTRVNGEINSDAVPFNIIPDTRSVSPSFGYFGSIPTGEFTTSGGFDNLGGTNFDGPANELEFPFTPADLTQPFDALSIPVRVISPVQDLVLTINPSNDEAADASDEGIILWRDNDPIPVDQILATERNVITINATAGSNQNPVPGDPQDLGSFAENAGTQQLALAVNASDPDGDTVSVTAGSLAIVSGDGSGLTLDAANNRVTLDPSVYSALNDGQSEAISFTYGINDGNGGTATASANVTVTGVSGANQPPVAGDPQALGSFAENAGIQQFTLAVNASDPDGDTISVTAGSLVITSGNGAGLTLDAANNRLTLDPGAYSALNDNESEAISFTYGINDGNGGTATASGNLTVTGITDTGNRPPDPGALQSLGSFSEDAGTQQFTLAVNATDPDGDTISVTADSLVITSGDGSGLSLDAANNRLILDPNAYNALNDNESEAISFTYGINDGNGGTATAAGNLTVTGVTDDPGNRPPVAGDIQQLGSFSEDAGTQQFTLAVNASDPDGDTISVTPNSLTITSGDGSGLTLDAPNNRLILDPNAYNALNEGQSEAISFTYEINDGNGGTATAAGNLTVTGADENQNPTVSGPIALGSVTEDDGTLTFSLLTNSSDPDGDALNVDSTSFNVTGNAAGISLSGNSLVVNTGAYGSLNDGQSEPISVSFNLVDGRGGSVSQTASITVTGVTDPFEPSTVSGAVFHRSDRQHRGCLVAVGCRSDP